MKKEIPNGAKRDGKGKLVEIGKPTNFQKEVACWRINKFDVESKWGATAAFGDFEFNYLEEILTEVINLNDDNLDVALTKLKDKSFKSVEKFWEQFNSLYNKPISPLLVAKINSAIGRSFFIQKIYPKLVAFEDRTWEEIEKDTYGNDNKTKHHFVKIDKFIKEARDRIVKMNLKDTDELFSLRLEGKIRIYGTRRLNYMEIIWVDPKHEICPSKKK